MSEFIYGASQVVNVLYPDQNDNLVWYKVVPLPFANHFGPLVQGNQPEWIIHVYDIEKKIRRRMAINLIEDWRVVSLVNHEVEPRTPLYSRFS